MNVAVSVGSIQGNSRFTLLEGEWGNSTMAERGIFGKVLVLIGIVLKGRWDISWFRNPQGVVPLLNQTNVFLILRFIYVSVIQK